ncbi:class I SAM-dependent methyltransferase [Desulfogranum mediterraneum]|uniref:class I SAM-dependent methyltransferase n=1 Tax=Desulfogranum mediterraneum TaxID=160661 RepID=UPI0004225BAD|nr:hypothetical protein [Desulfogranum mediterraneum]
MNPENPPEATLDQADIDALIRSYDRVGDIIITTIPGHLLAQEQRIGQRLLQLHPSVRVVAKRVGPHHGDFRTRKLAVIAGEPRKETRHRENGVWLHLNPESVYYSGRLAGERLRIAQLVEAGEEVAVFCSGVGPFPLVIARHSAAAAIIGIEKNPLAHGFALQNLQANRRIQNVRFLLGDAGQAPSRLKQSVDRLITVLPTAHTSLLDSAIQTLRPGGTLHHYAMVEQGANQVVVTQIRAACRHRQRRLEAVTYRRCGHCGPTTDRVCFQATIL